MRSLESTLHKLYIVVAVDSVEGVEFKIPMHRVVYSCFNRLRSSAVLQSSFECRF